jgi:pimeloyl-ACP methyl ester carboxylesterase
MSGPLDPALATPEACAEQCRAVCRALQLPAVHVVAHGLGALPALRLAASSDGPDVRSLTLVSPYGCAADLRAGALGDVGAVKSLSTLAGRLLPTVSSNARDSCVAEAREGAGGSLLLSLLAGAPTGAAAASLRGDALGQRLQQPLARGMPVLLATGGARDIVESAGWDALPPSVTQHTFATAGHLPFVEARESFLLAQLEFLDRADKVTTNREFKFAPLDKTLKEVFAASQAA